MTYCASVLPADATIPSPDARKHNIDIILPEGAPAATAKMIEDVFRAANDLLTERQYQVALRDLSGQPVEDPRYWSRRTVVFLGDIHSRWTLRSEERARVHQILRLARRIVLVGGAVFILSETGQQSRHACAVHPNFVAAASEEHLSEAEDGAHLCSDGKLFSAISPVAALRLSLDIVASDHGAFIADSLSAYIGFSEAHAQRPHSRVSLGLLQQARGDQLINASLELMQEHLEEPLRIDDLARELGVSTRKLQRRFLERTGNSPLTAYRALRIERAHQLLKHTSLPLSEIVVATGFGTCSNLARWFRQEVGESPKTVRQRAFAGAA